MADRSAKATTTADGYETLKARDIAVRINAHLKRFEANPKINKRRNGLSEYFYASACDGGGYVQITYITYQGHTSLRKADAAEYLRKLDGGFVGRHFEALRQEVDNG